MFSFTIRHGSGGYSARASVRPLVVVLAAKPKPLEEIENRILMPPVQVERIDCHMETSHLCGIFAHTEHWRVTAPGWKLKLPYHRRRSTSRRSLARGLVQAMLHQRGPDLLTACRAIRYSECAEQRNNIIRKALASLRKRSGNASAAAVTQLTD